ncbi:GNAT family N-acetyltransferase [Pedobacter hartonius]|uniref:Ribosomal protein S18 acetylase RimI n=1 Tax=Pedobacter hartonius TaxID=425514 RepID=A0A1H4GL58_9SPHI|nr:GNAT family N-acetyltransferase [Pedobacter hartonius]SEB10304.1 Ribosomal protein S18 acetylase RimI [Pedobacter hartonius]
MTISKAIITDIPELYELVNLTYRGKTTQMGWTTEADLLDGLRIDEEMLTAQMNKENAVIFKYTDEKTNKIVGAIYLETEHSKMYFGMLTVSPSAQGSGIGKSLLTYAEDHAINNNCTTLTATVIDVRSELIEWYVRLGFIRTGRIEPFPTDGKVGIPRIPVELVEIEKNILIS